MGDFFTFEEFLDGTFQIVSFLLDFPWVGRASKPKNEEITTLFLSFKRKTIAKATAEQVIEVYVLAKETV